MAGYIGTQAVSVNTTSATISDDLSVGDDLTVTDDATIGGTALVTGILTTTAKAVFNGGFGLPDSQKATFGGTGTGDLQIYHDGSHSFISDQGTGNLQILTNQLSVNNAANDEALLQAIQDGAVNLYYNGSKKLETTNTGVTATGGLTVTAGLASGTGVGASGANGNLRLYSNGTQSVTVDTSGHVIIADGNLVIDTAGHGINFQAYGAGTGIDSNLLDDYEEGTFTPTLSIGGTALASTGGVGRYTKVGRKVYIEGSVTRNTADGASGTLLIHALPFTILNANSIGVMGAGTIWMDAGGPSTGFGDTIAFVYAAGGNTYFQAVRATSVGAVTASRYGQAEKLANGRPVYFNFSYTTA